MRTDSAYHALLWVSEWPRSSVCPDFLRPLLLASGIPRTFSMIFTPVRADVAARDIRKKKVGLMSDATQRALMGQIEDAERAAEFRDVLQQESDLTAGHGVRPTPASLPSRRVPRTSSRHPSLRSNRPRYKPRARPAGSSGSRPGRSRSRRCLWDGWCKRAGRCRMAPLALASPRYARGVLVSVREGRRS